MGFEVAIAGATGAVGREFMSILQARSFPISRLRLMASPRSAGSTLPWKGQDIVVEDLARASFSGVDVAFFSAGSALKAEALRATCEGALVIDNSSAFRMDPEIPLMVPEVNGDEHSPEQRLIANPNCTTILLVMVLAPLERHVRIRRVVVSTYQAVSGTGAAALAELDAQLAADQAGQPLKASIYPKVIHGNAIPFVSGFGEGGLTVEEWKVIKETRRILGRPELAISATCVRVPVRRAHSESVNIEFERPVSPAEVRQWLRAAPGVQVHDDPGAMVFPSPREADGGDDVLVGRIRSDPGRPGGIDLWLTGDQLRKGAALNAVQIAEQVLAIQPAQRRS